MIRTQSMEEEFWDCREDSLSQVSVEVNSIRNRSLSEGSADRDSRSTSGYSGSSTSDSDELEANLQDFAFEELGETPEVSFQINLNFVCETKINCIIC